MNKLTLVFVFMFWGIFLSSNAQSDNYSRLFLYNPGMFNPAATGLESKNFVMANFNSRWLKLENNPVRFSSGYERTIDKINSSIGAYYYYSQMWNISNTNTLGISYSYKFKFTDSHFLKLGIQLNVIRLYIDYSQNDPVIPDPCVSYVEESGIKADINLGIWYSWKKLSIGASVINVFRPVLIPYEPNCVYEEDGARLRRFFTFLTKYEIQLSKSFDLTPSIYFFSYSNFNLEFYDYLDYSLNLSYNNIINLGTVYSMNRASEWTIFAGAKIIKKINVQFSYGFPDKEVRDAGPVIEALISYSIN